MAILRIERPRRAWRQGAGLDEAAFRDLYREHLGPVLNYARYRLGADEADDVAADVFTRAWAARGTYDASEGPPFAWLWAIARNAVVDRLRARRSPPAALSSWLRAGDDPRNAAVQRDEWRRLMAAVGRLGDLDREIIALRFGAGHTNRAIAGMLVMTEANVAQRLRRALRAVRVALEGLEGENGR